MTINACKTDETESKKNSSNHKTAASKTAVAQQQ